jgi:triacylglycerol lipase
MPWRYHSPMANQEQKHWYDLPDPDWEHLFYPQRDYQYFRQPQPLSDAATVKQPSTVCTPVMAAWMADAAMLAYGRSGPELIPPMKFDDFLGQAGLTSHRIGDWSGTAKGSQGFFAFNSKFAVLSFRGTEKSDWTDALVDLMVLPVKEDQGLATPANPAKTLFHLGFRNPLLNPFNSTEIGVHGGFQEALNSVWGDVSNWLESYRDKNPISPIFFTGHSLGAALATLAIARFNRGGAALYTFGSPRAGNKPFCDQVGSKADLRIYRFVDKQDFVTTVPPRDMFYSHTSGLMHIEPDGTIRPDGTVPQDSGLAAITEILSSAALAAVDYVGKQPPPPELVDHSATRYCYYTWRWARGGQVP